MLHNNYTTDNTAVDPLVRPDSGTEWAETCRKKRTTVIHIFTYLSISSMTQNYTVLNDSRSGKEQTGDK